MQHDLKQFGKDTSDWELTASEKIHMRERLLLFIKRHPVMYAQPQRLHMWSNVINNFKLASLKPMPIFIVLALLLGGGVTFAENSPGDTCIPSRFILTSKSGIRGRYFEAKANWETKVAGRRLKEAEKLPPSRSWTWMSAFV